MQLGFIPYKKKILQKKFSSMDLVRCATSYSSIRVVKFIIYFCLQYVLLLICTLEAIEVTENFYLILGVEKLGTRKERKGTSFKCLVVLALEH